MLISGESWKKQLKVIKGGMTINRGGAWKILTGKFCWKNLHIVYGRYSILYSCTVTKRIVGNKYAKVKSKKCSKQYIPCSRGKKRNNLHNLCDVW